MNTKICTSLKQSKELAEILPIESADMSYSIIHNIGQEPYHCNVPTFTYVANGDIPCWSLAALLRVIPKHIKDYNVLRIDISDKDFAIWYDEIGYGVNNELPNITEKSAVDACVSVIIKLKERKLI